MGKIRNTGGRLLAWLAAGLPRSTRLALPLASLLFAASCDNASGNSRAVSMLRSGLDKSAGGVLVEFDLTHGVSEQAAPFSLLSGGGAPTYAELVQVLARAANDRRTHGFFIRLGESELNWAQAEELGHTFSALPPEQPVICHAHGYSNTTLFFALRACDRVWLSPAGEVG